MSVNGCITISPTSDVAGRHRISALDIISNYYPFITAIGSSFVLTFTKSDSKAIT